MDLASAALEAHKAQVAAARADRELRTAQNRRRQHQAIEELADSFGIGPVPIDELFSCGEPNTLTHWHWAYPITDQVSLVISTTKLTSGLNVEAKITDHDPRDRNQAHRAQRVQSLADIGAYISTWQGRRHT